MIVPRLLILCVSVAAMLPWQIGCRSTPVISPIVSTESTAGLTPGPKSQGSSDEEEGNVRQASFMQPVEEGISPSFVSTSDGPEYTLSDAIRRAIDANPDLVSVAEQLAYADASLARARAEFYPKLGVVEQYGVTNNPVTAFMFQLNQRLLDPAQDFNNPSTTDNFHTQILLQHTLYSGGRRLHQMHAAEAQRNTATLSLLALQNQLVFRVAEAYYRVLQARALLEVRLEAVTQVEQHLKSVKTRFHNDTAVKSDVLTVEVRLAEVREALISAQNQLQLAWAVLENVTGAPIETRMLPDSIPVAPWSEHVRKLELAISAATTRRAEIGALASRRRAATEGVLVAEAGKRIGVDLVTNYDVFTGDFERAGDSFFAGLVIQLNLFDGGRTRTEVARAAAKVRQLQAHEKRLILDIELDVRRAYLQHRDAEARLGVAAQAIKQGRENLREIEVRYRGQNATITQLIDAQVALSNTRVRQTSAEAEVQIARAALQRAMGRLDELVAP